MELTYSSLKVTHSLSGDCPLNEKIKLEFLHVQSHLEKIPSHY